MTSSSSNSRLWLLLTSSFFPRWDDLVSFIFEKPLIVEAILFNECLNASIIGLVARLDFFPPAVVWVLFFLSKAFGTVFISF